MDLKHLHDEANERRGLAVTSEGPADVVELHSFVHKSLRRQTEALLLPIGVVVYLRPYDLLDQVLRVRPPYALRRGVRAVRHCSEKKEIEIKGDETKAEGFECTERGTNKP